MAIEKAKDRLEVLARIEEYERKGLFSKDVENDPQTIPLQPNQVDYLNKKFKNRILTKFVNKKARKFIDNLIETKQLIIKNVIGYENFEKIQEEGIILTCNHFNAFDNFAIHKVLEDFLLSHKTELYKVIREGNYTSFPGLYGLFFRHCNTLPLSSNFSVMKEFMHAISVLLKRKEKILVYAEQGMWWNYRKPRPLTPGAFRFAVTNNVPVLPIFITMNDSDIIGNDGFPIQEYTLHFLPPIYPNKNLKFKENVEMLRLKNYEMWKDVYEKTYGIPLEYLKPEETSK